MYHIVLTKVSLLMPYHDIFVTPSFRLAIKVARLVLSLWWIGAFLTPFLICRPIKLLWEPEIQGDCGNRHLYMVLTQIPWIVTDVVVLVMPIPVVWKLHSAIRRRLRVATVFLLGGL